MKERRRRNWKRKFTIVNRYFFEFEAFLRGWSGALLNRYEKKGEESEGIEGMNRSNGEVSYMISGNSRQGHWELSKVERKLFLPFLLRLPLLISPNPNPTFLISFIFQLLASPLFNGSQGNSVYIRPSAPSASSDSILAVQWSCHHILPGPSTPSKDSSLKQSPLRWAWFYLMDQFSGLGDVGWTVGTGNQRAEGSGSTFETHPFPGSLPSNFHE